jgi:uncharacterized protein YneF (UPF0154 family)
MIIAAGLYSLITFAVGVIYGDFTARREFEKK